MRILPVGTTPAVVVDLVVPVACNLIPVGQRCSLVKHNTQYVPDFMYDNRNSFDIPQARTSKKLSAAAKRNAFWLKNRNLHDWNLLCKCHLPQNLSDLFGPPLSTPDDEDFIPPAWLLQSIEK